ncbi:MAG: MazG nucleotide pyrophosphohydrolase domain-containing protein [Corynebacterium sp.]|nr:MazG nucleotide pyrophosphohydrolase domain-containing protein [Corynebacterium sp.]
MAVVLLDPRYPTMIPFEALNLIQGAEIEYTEEVPVRVRWNIADFSARTVENGTVLVSTNAEDPKVIDRANKNELFVTADSRGDHQVPVRFKSIEEALHVMHLAHLRGQWEANQTHESLIPYLREETEEFAVAVDMWKRLGEAGEGQLKRELSDVLLQVLFHAEIAARRGAFNFEDVAQAFVDKMRHRAPYLFDGSTDIISEEEQDRIWQEAKNRPQI